MELGFFFRVGGMATSIFYYCQEVKIVTSNGNICSGTHSLFRSGYYEVKSILKDLLVFVFLCKDCGLI